MTHPIPHYPRRPLVTETLYPNADITVSVWTATPLHDKIDETTPFDSTSIQANQAFSTEECPTKGEEVSFVVQFPDFTDTPSGSENFEMEVRAELVELIATGHCAEMDIEWLQGASTVIKENAAIPITTSWAQYDIGGLSGAQIASLLADTSDMRARISIRGGVDTAGDEAEPFVSMVRIRVFP